MLNQLNGPCLSFRVGKRCREGVDGGRGEGQEYGEEFGEGGARGEWFEGKLSCAGRAGRDLRWPIF
jgi:hypothetical protein